jgi:hypothetical protein
MAGQPDTGVDKAELKKLLIRSKREPVHCAVGIGKDQQALIMLDKIKPPRAISKEIEKKFGDVKTPRWGSAFVDVDEDPKLVILTLNKPISGFARRLKKTLRGTGFSKVEVRLKAGPERRRRNGSARCRGNGSNCRRTAAAFATRYRPARCRGIDTEADRASQEDAAGYCI